MCMKTAVRDHRAHCSTMFSLLFSYKLALDEKLRAKKKNYEIYSDNQYHSNYHGSYTNTLTLANSSAIAYAMSSKCSSRSGESDSFALLLKLSITENTDTLPYSDAT